MIEAHVGHSATAYRRETAVEKFLAGKRALVTGGGQGVGRGIALALADAGASVALCGRTRAKLDAVASEVEELGGRATTIVCDVKDGASVTETVATVVREFGGLEILVNNAQEPPMGTMLEVTDEAYTAGFESGPLAALRFMRACHPHLAGGGVIINLGSGTAVNPQPIGRGVYSSVKQAITTLSRTAGVEWGSDGIRCISVLPAATSPASESFAKNSPEAYAASMQSIPLHRLGDSRSEIGPVVAFLCSDAAGFLTATTIAIDGGQAYLR